jgi:hypothetical protein
VAKAQLLTATESFAVETGRREDGSPVLVIVRGGITKVHATDPIVKGREHLFEAADQPNHVSDQ